MTTRKRAKDTVPKDNGDDEAGELTRVELDYRRVGCGALDEYHAPSAHGIDGIFSIHHAHS